MSLMRKAFLAAAACAVLGSASAASAAGPTVTSTAVDLPLPKGMIMIDDFDHSIASGFTFTGGFVRSGSLGLLVNISAPPPGDKTNYETILGGTSATLTSVKLLKNISLYMGSPDSFNSIRFIGPKYDYTLTGAQLIAPIKLRDGDQTFGRRFTYDFGSYAVNKVVFASARNSFEFDNLAGTVRAVPEPSTWAMMLVGFFGLGSAIRQRRKVVA